MNNKIVITILCLGLTTTVSNNCMEITQEIATPQTSLDVLLSGKDPRLPLKEIESFFSITPQTLLTKEEIEHRKAFGANRNLLKKLLATGAPNPQKVK